MMSHLDWRSILQAGFGWACRESLVRQFEVAMRKLLESLRQDESAQNLIEYALVAALIALGAVASIQTLSTAIGNAFTAIETQLNSALA